MKDDLLPVRHIIDAIAKISKYTEGKNFEDFIQDSQLYDAVLMELIIIGEQSARASDKIKTKYPEVPWHKITGMRNAISHDYFSIKPKIAWDTVTKELPKLKKQLTQIIDD